MLYSLLKVEWNGIAHYGMPIVVQSVNINEFIIWINNQLVLVCTY